jgi:hypothetical protein
MKTLVLLLFISISFASYGMELMEERSIDKIAGVVAAMKWQIENNSPAPRTLPDEDYANAWHQYMTMLQEVQAQWDDHGKRNTMEAELRTLNTIDRKRTLQLLNAIEDINRRLGIKDQPGRENEVGNWMRGILNQAIKHILLILLSKKEKTHVR